MSYRILLGADDDVGRWVHAQARGEWINGQGVAIGITSAESLVAGVTYSQYNGCNIWAAIAVDANHQGRWACKRTLRAIFDYPFRFLKCKRISALVYDTNKTSQEFLKRLGFHHEATLVNAATDGHMHVFALFAEDCRWTDKHERRRRKATPGT